MDRCANNADNFVDICPDESEIFCVKRHSCPEKDCTDTFNSVSTLHMHLTKHHRREKLLKTHITGQVNRYFCPVLDCRYHKLAKTSTRKHFTSLKYLRQHCIKVHAPKTFACTRCEKAFPSHAYQIAHERVCAVNFICSVCSWTYCSKEALQTHIKRKKHGTYLPADNSKWKTELTDAEIKVPPSHQVRPPTCDQSVQTSELTKTKVTKRIASQTTQTCANSYGKKVKKSTETQTVRKGLQHHSGTTTDSHQISSATQTNATRIGKVTEVDLFDSENSILIDGSSQTQNNLNNMSYFEDSLTCFEPTDTFSIETQTELNTFFSNTPATNDSLDQLLYTHMHTQTCDSILNELGLSDIQTQTNCSSFDFLVSTETQTMNPLITDPLQCSSASQTSDQRRILDEIEYQSIQTQT